MISADPSAPIQSVNDQIWVCELGTVDSLEAATVLCDRAGFVWLDSALPNSRSWSYLCCDPIDTFQLATGQSGEVFDRLNAWLGGIEGNLASDKLPAFTGGVLGYLAYDAVFDLLPDLQTRHKPHGPTAAFGLYDTVLAIDHGSGRSVVMSRGLAGPGAKPNKNLAIDKIRSLISVIGSEAVRKTTFANLDWQPTTNKQEHLRRVEATKDYILAGDIYQANIAQCFEAELAKSVRAFDLYLQIRRSNPAPHAAWLDLGERKIASTSPERLVSLSVDGLAEARPIKGTCRRSQDLDEDAALRAALQTSEKDRAENIMIVDLLRNDLSRVCAPGSVKVPRLCGLESYAGLHHLTSVVTGQLKAGQQPADLLRAIFPGGSITGAPKHRAVQIIDELEAQSRGAFCGSLGYIGFDGAMDFNIIIRTIEIVRNTARLMSGGGITLLSNADREYEETLLKADRIFASFQRQGAAA